MNEGWIKLHRKILQNDAIFRGGSTFPVWCLLLLLADRNGVVKIGRYQLAGWLKIKPSTVYKALKRLQSLTMIGLKSNNQVTTISILNWGVYQNKGNNEVTAVEQPSNTYTRIENKNKELRNKEDKEEAPNKLNLTRGQLLTYAKTYQGLTTTEIKEQQGKCNAYMGMSSSNYSNPGLFFKGWLEKCQREKKIKEIKEAENKRILDSLPITSPEQVEKNLAKLADMRKELRLGVNR